MTAYKPRQRPKDLRGGQRKTARANPRGDDRLEPRLQSCALPTRDPERTRRARGPILRGPTHQELEHDVGGEGEEGVKGASAPARLRDSSPARGRNPPPGSGLRPAPPCPALSIPEATRGAAAPSDGRLGKQEGEVQTQASLYQFPLNSHYKDAGNCVNTVRRGAP